MRQQIERMKEIFEIHESTVLDSRLEKKYQNSIDFIKYIESISEGCPIGENAQSFSTHLDK